MQKLNRVLGYFILAVTCIASNLGIANAGPVRLPEATMSMATDPVYLQASHVTTFSPQITPSDMQRMYHPSSHYSHSSHTSHASHQSHYSSYKY